MAFKAHMVKKRSIVNSVEMDKAQKSLSKLAKSEFEKSFILMFNFWLRGFLLKLMDFVQKCWTKIAMQWYLLTVYILLYEVSKS